MVPALEQPSAIPVILLPKSSLGVALPALNDLEPRWGYLLAKRQRESGTNYQASSKGVFPVDYRDDSEAALRAVELPSPLDVQVAQFASKDGPLEGGALKLRELLSSGIARFEPNFQPLPDPEDLHPCPPATWCRDEPPATLPAMELECHGSTAEDYLALADILERSSGGAGSSSSTHARAGKQSPFTFAELFAGVGGFRLALERLGGQCIFSSEIHPTARAVYIDNWPGEAVGSSFAGDIRLIPSDEIPDHDILVGGFPCQPFSALGKQEGLQDTRGRLFLHICRILRIKRPQAALLENVPGLLKCDDGAALEEVLKGLQDSGYRVAYKILNSATVLPQRRRRVYIVAIRADLSKACESFRYPWLPELSRPISDALEEDLPEQTQKMLTVSDAYWKKLLGSRAYCERPEDIVAVLDQQAAPLISGYGSSKSVGAYATVTQFVPQEGMRPRLLTQRECARLQGFPESFSIDRCADQHMAWFKRMGNAISVPVATAVAHALVAALETDQSALCATELQQSESPDSVARMLLPGTGTALLAALEACPVSRRQQFLERKAVLPDGTGPVSVAVLLKALTNQDPYSYAQDCGAKIEHKRASWLKSCCFQFL